MHCMYGVIYLQKTLIEYVSITLEHYLTTKALARMLIKDIQVPVLMEASCQMYLGLVINILLLISKRLQDDTQTLEQLGTVEDIKQS